MDVIPAVIPPGPIGLTGAYWLDDRPNASGNNMIQRHAVDHQRL
jgi:hypothetical protein